MHAYHFQLGICGTGCQVPKTQNYLAPWTAPTLSTQHGRWTWPKLQAEWRRGPPKPPPAPNPPPVCRSSWRASSERITRGTGFVTASTSRAANDSDPEHAIKPGGERRASPRRRRRRTTAAGTHPLTLLTFTEGPSPHGKQRIVQGVPAPRGKAPVAQTVTLVCAWRGWAYWHLGARCHKRKVDIPQ